MKYDDDNENIKKDDKRQRDDDKLKPHQPVEFLKKKLENDKKKEKEKLMEKNPSPNAKMVPCIRCGRTHVKGAKCPP